MLKSLVAKRFGNPKVAWLHVLADWRSPASCLNEGVEGTSRNSDTDVPCVLCALHMNSEVQVLLKGLCVYFAGQVLQLRASQRPSQRMPQMIRPPSPRQFMSCRIMTIMYVYLQVVEEIDDAVLRMAMAMTEEEHIHSDT